MADFLNNKFVQYSFVRCQNFTPVACQSLNFRMPWGRHMNQGAMTFIGPINIYARKSRGEASY